MLVELKNGETLNGHLVNCDTWMNLTLKEVVQTSPVGLSSRLLDCSLRFHPSILTDIFLQEGDKFFRLAECYVRGNNVSFLHTSSTPQILSNIR